MSSSLTTPTEKKKKDRMIIKKRDGYYVLSEKTRRNLGGPYKTREEAVKRLRQVEYFKHKKG